MKQRISFNANAQRIGDRQKFIDFIAALQPTSVLIMDDLTLAADLHNVLNGQSIVVHRSYNESSINLNMSPEAVVERWAKDGHPEVWRYALNEPNNSDQTLNWLIRLMEISSKRGYKVVVGNWAVGTFERNDVFGGRWDNFIKALDRYKNNAIHGIHEYMFGILPWAWYDFNQIDEPSKVGKDGWPKPPFNDSGDNWLLLRSLWFNARARQLGLQPHMKLITEYGWDRLPNLESGYPEQTHQLDAYTFDQGWRSSRAAGVNTMRRLFSKVFPQWSFEQSIIEQLKWTDSVYPDDYVGFDLFTWSFSDDWVAGGYNFAGLSDLHKLMIEWTKDLSGTTKAPDEPNVILMPIPDTDARWNDFTISPINGVVNLRYVPNTTGNTPFGQLSSPVVGKAVINAIDGWSQIKFGTTIAWVLTSLLSFAPIEHKISISLTYEEKDYAMQFAEAMLRRLKM